MRSGASNFPRCKPSTSRHLTVFSCKPITSRHPPLFLPSTSRHPLGAIALLPLFHAAAERAGGRVSGGAGCGAGRRRRRFWRRGLCFGRRGGGALGAGGGGARGDGCLEV